MWMKSLGYGKIIYDDAAHQLTLESDFFRNSNKTEIKLFIHEDHTQ